MCVHFVLKWVLLLGLPKRISISSLVLPEKVRVFRVKPLTKKFYLNPFDWIKVTRDSEIKSPIVESK